MTSATGSPTLTLSDGRVATYAKRFELRAVAFTYTVAAGQSSTDVPVTTLNLNAGTIKDVAGNTAVVSPVRWQIRPVSPWRRPVPRP